MSLKTIFIQWIVIYSMNSAIHPLNNWGLKGQGGKTDEWLSESKVAYKICISAPMRSFCGKVLKWRSVTVRSNNAKTCHRGAVRHRSQKCTGH